MKIKQIATAISAVLLSGSAFALAPTNVPDITIYMSGASAQDKAIATLFGNICVSDANGPTDLDIYKDDSVKPGKAYTSYFCTVDNVKAGFPSTDTTVRKVLFNKRSKGGSGEGVNPVLNEVAIDAMNIFNNNCTKTAPETFYRCNITALDASGNPTGNLIKVVSDAGVSDVNPEMFVGANTPAGNTPVNAATVALKMVVKSAAAAVFGIPVTTTLRNALQEAEFGIGSPCVKSDTEACMPSLNKRQVASLATGMIKNWSAFKVNGVALTSVASILPTSTKVTFCRRVDGSGTQAQMNANFLHYPCTANAVAPASTGNPFVGPVVIKNEGSGDMSVCLNDFNNGTNGTGQNNDPLIGGPVTAWAFGLQSTEKNGNLKDDYRFIKIDGVAPTIQNAANGKYLDWAEQTFQWRKPAYTGPAGDKLTIIETIARTASNPTTIGNLDTKLIQPWGQGGYLAVSTNFAPAANGILDVTAPVIPYTHAASGKLDNCTVPLLNNAYQAPQL
ncbi:MAG: hypothetical protein GXP11_09280 [Gammaproteobacteria bacterium]|nr:hypothetical protein [Gammaproteobacteria bacterium]